MLRFILFFMLCLSPLCGGDFHDFDRYQKKLSKETLQNRLKNYLQIDEGLEHYYSLSETQFVLYGSLDDKMASKSEYVLELANEDELIQKNLPSLAHAKIAIDPGHLGGIYKYLEARFIEIPNGDSELSAYTFDEGSLAYLTAIYLKTLLEQEGASVFITRQEIGVASYPEDFFTWLRKNPSLWCENKNLKEIFRIYNNQDLKWRAKLINEFQPDLTIIIHYNAKDVTEKGESNYKTLNENYNMFLIPGGFGSNELKDQPSRYEFLRQLVSSDLKFSQELSEQIAKALTEQLQVPLLTKDKASSSLTKWSLEISEGIYSRNLALTRMIHSPLCYGETLIQNDEQEVKRLGIFDTEIDSIPCSSRLKEVAQGYFEGIKAFLNRY